MEKILSSLQNVKSYGAAWASTKIPFTKVCEIRQCTTIDTPYRKDKGNVNMRLWRQTAGNADVRMSRKAGTCDTSPWKLKELSGTIQERSHGCQWQRYRSGLMKLKWQSFASNEKHGLPQSLMCTVLVFNLVFNLLFFSISRFIACVRIIFNRCQTFSFPSCRYQFALLLRRDFEDYIFGFYIVFIKGN